MKKKRIVENDKSKILDTIEELDQKKNEALKIAWQKVKPPTLLAWLFLKVIQIILKPVEMVCNSGQMLTLLKFV